MVKRRMLFTAIGFFFALLLAMGALRADMIFLEDGRVIEGEITDETDDEVVIRTSSGATMRLESWQVAKVVGKEDILKEYELKKKELDSEDANALYELAKWCAKNGLKEEYEKELAETLKLDPDHAEAKKELDILQGKIELPEKPRQLTEEEKEELKKKAQARREARKAKEKSRKEKKKPYPFGTVTRDSRTPGDLDCKGDCHRLKQGGYMKFDLNGHKTGSTMRSASLKVYVKSSQKNPWLWVCRIPMDPTTASVAEVHAAIQAHKVLLSGAQKVQPGGWRTIRLNRKAVQAINEVLAKDGNKWFALSLTFE